MEGNSNKSRAGLVAAVSLTVLLAMLGIAAASSPNTPPSSSAQVQSAAARNAFAPATTPSLQAAPVQAVQSEPQQAEVQSIQTKQGNDLSNDSHYTNSSGNTVHAPVYDLDNDVPAGASAKCGDGTYSFSQHHSGTCSHHGGVSEWLQ